MESKKGVSKGVLLGVLLIIVLVLGVIGASFYIYDNKPSNVEEKTFDGGRVSLTYTDEANLFTIENAVPTSDLVGIKYDSADLFFDFSVKTEIEEANYVEYEIILVKDETVSTALDNNIKVYLEKEDRGTYTKVAGPDTFVSDVDDNSIGKQAMSFYKQKKSSDGTDNYRLRMWLSDTAVFSPEEVQNYGIKIAIRGIAK